VWGTPLDKTSDVLRADMFRIEGTDYVPYIGILERKVLTMSSFMTLQPNQRIQTSIDLAKG